MPKKPSSTGDGQKNGASSANGTNAGNGANGTNSTNGPSDDEAKVASPKVPFLRRLSLLGGSKSSPQSTDGHGNGKDGNGSVAAKQDKGKAKDGSANGKGAVATSSNGSSDASDANGAKGSSGTNGTKEKRQVRFDDVTTSIPEQTSHGKGILGFLRKKPTSPAPSSTAVPPPKPATKASSPISPTSPTSHAPPKASSSNAPDAPQPKGASKLESKPPPAKGSGWQPEYYFPPYKPMNFSTGANNTTTASTASASSSGFTPAYYFPPYKPMAQPAAMYTNGQLCPFPHPSADAVARLHSACVGHPVSVYYPALPLPSAEDRKDWRSPQFGETGWTGTGPSGEKLPDAQGRTFSAPMPDGDPILPPKPPGESGGGGGGKKKKKKKPKKKGGGGGGGGGDGDGDDDGDGGDGDGDGDD